MSSIEIDRALPGSKTARDERQKVEGIGKCSCDTFVERGRSVGNYVVNRVADETIVELDRVKRRHHGYSTCQSGRESCRGRSSTCHTSDTNTRART